MGPLGNFVLLGGVDVGLEMRQVGVKGRLGDELVHVKEKDEGGNSQSDDTGWAFLGVTV